MENPKNGGKSMNDKQRRGKVCLKSMERLNRILQQAIHEEEEKRKEREREIERKIEDKKESIKCPECRRLLEEAYEGAKDEVKAALHHFQGNISVWRRKSYFTVGGKSYFTVKDGIVEDIIVESCTPCQKLREEEQERHNRIAKYNQNFNNVFGGMTQ